MVISNKPLLFLVAITVALLPIFSKAKPATYGAKIIVEVAQKEQAESSAVNSEATNIKSEIKEFINHHLLEDHDFTFNANRATGEHYRLSLPIILWDNGLQVFASSKFHHGLVEYVAEHNGNFYKLHHGKIYKTNASGQMTVEHNHPTNEEPLDLSISKSVVGIMFVVVLMFLLFTGLAKSYAKNGGIATGAGRFFEPLVLYVRDEIAIPNIGEKHHKKYMGYLLTIFFFILFLNLLGLTPFGFNVTGNIAITASLALLTYLITTFTANKNYWGHIFWMPGVPTPMKFILAPIELLGTVIKPFSLMIRLYANILAGHVVLMSIIGLMFIFKSWIGSSLSFALAFALSILEILVAFLQAYIFTMLSALYFGAGNEEHHHEEAH
jgi:F-type H+-transporting ATPase subunit a